MASRKRLIAQEIRQEKLAMYERGRYTSLTQALLRWPSGPIDLTYPSIETKRDRKGKPKEQVEVLVRAQDLCNSSKWEDFLRYKGYIKTQLIHLTDVPRLTSEYILWLTTIPASVPSTDRYRNMDSGGVLWARKVVSPEIKHHHLDSKIYGWWEQQQGNPAYLDEDYFCDDMMAELYLKIWILNTEVIESGYKTTNKAGNVKDADMRKQLLQEHYEKHEERLQTRPFPERDKLVAEVERYWVDLDKKDEDDGEAGEAVAV